MKLSFEKLKSGLSKTKGNLLGRISEAVGLHKKIDKQLLDDLDEILIKADVGPSTTAKIIEGLRSEALKNKIETSEKVTELLKDQVASILATRGVSGDNLSSPHVIMMVGVNGTGKTTSIAKLAKDYKDQGKKVLVAACDTFRAAAGEQLSIWAERVGVEMVRSMPSQDPASVAFDAIKSAGARGLDVVIADTAGRLHTKVNLMEELKKIQRVMGKALPGAPHEVLLVIDATTGQNGLSQVRMFRDAVGVTGIFLTKLDGTAKGGIMIAIADQFQVPVKYIGLGEKPDDFQRFDPVWFAEALFA
ncbi:MAG: signal recognition particle-docking protein FtsY [candidate division Zixibacteria bacterium]|nr:signal recognition particle-docking protein FtsY [candidate division Zixibacteria bacterium]